ncbi:hypothetical protein XU18_0624 [Perkinsela sp. CCAP 1560/4]|nr:hypothetical protein XU18_0624 [Perkinsela sp. CCAP 1560/4]|eukprot:KNH09114.1 hypothetical protein XU18_0624 [Perkinsela sp. CCAP 1560/4]
MSFLFFFSYVANATEMNMPSLILQSACILHTILADDANVGEEGIPLGIFTEFIEVLEEDFQADEPIGETAAAATVGNPPPTEERYSEEIIQHVERLVNVDIREKTHPLIEVQHAIRMTGMWSSYHLETPRSSHLVDILKILFGKNQTRVRSLLETFQQHRSSGDGHAQQERLDGVDETGGDGVNPPVDSRLQLVFPTLNESFLEQFHVEERDDMGIDISALDVFQKTFTRFPAFYFNPRVHCYSPFRNATILCSVRPAVF